MLQSLGLTIQRFFFRCIKGNLKRFYYILENLLVNKLQEKHREYCMR